MSTFAIGGLASGIDTASLITQLMAVAAQPQTQLKAKLTTQQTVLSAYQAINTKMTALQAAADAVKQASTWTAAAASSSSSSVVASNTSAAQAGASMTFNVTQLAAAQVSTVAVNGDAVSAPASGIDILDSNNVSHHIDLTDGTAATVAAAVNNAGVGVRASVINTDAGQLLQFASTTTGTSGAFTVNGLASTPQRAVAAQNAQISVGNPASGGYTISSQTNTFNDALPGVTFTAGAVASNVTVSVASDSAAITKAMQTLVDAANAALGEIGKDAGKGAVLQGNSQITSLTQSIFSAISHGTNTGGSFNTIGVTLTSTATITFDATAFAAAYAADPTKTQNDAGASLATTLSAFAGAASAPVTGTLSQLITSGGDQIIDLGKQIDAWDTRLADQQTALQQKYSAMESVLSKLKNQTAYLTSALASIDGSNSKNN